jgi:cryptochrome
MSKGSAIHWFRKGLRLSDNPALLQACAEGSKLYPVFIMDPKFCQGQMSVNRHSFLLQSLHDLDKSLRDIGSRLFVAKGKPDQILPELVKKWNITLVTYECDTGPYSRERDAKVEKKLNEQNCKIVSHYSHTLFPMDQWITKCGPNGTPKSYGSFVNMFKTLGPPRKPVRAPVREDIPNNNDVKIKEEDADYDIPTLLDLGYSSSDVPTSSNIFPGGETIGLTRLKDMVTDRSNWVKQFEKPMTAPNSLDPSTTALGPYITMGCVSVSTFFYEVVQCKPQTDPPVSLIGQLLWREYFYLNSVTTPNFHRMIGNPGCRQIPWRRDADLINAWKEAKTGFPFIDAIMTQLKVQGWIHHLARHAVACFLTRGDLWQHWEEGAKHFEYTLLDGDYALNNANWQWLSCSRFYYQYSRCYSPIAFGKKTDKNGDYIRKWLPKLANMPAKYIYEPWTAPIDVQRAAGCLIGTDYPSPLVDHTIESKANMGKMQAAYALEKEGGSVTMPEPTALGWHPTSASTTSHSTEAASSSSSGRKVKAEEATQSISTFFTSNKKARKE